MQEMQVVSNNLANSSTTGYKSDRAIFSEFLAGSGMGDDVLSMGGLGAHAFQLEQGNLKMTGGQFDLALEGEGYFTVDTGNGQRLTRSGHFQLDPAGKLVDMAGSAVLDASGNPIIVSPEVTQVAISGDGTVSADGQILGQIGVVRANGELSRDSNTYFSAPGGTTAVENTKIVQGALEQSNVSPVLEVARMIEVQRAYEAGQTVLEREDERIGQLISTVRER